MRLYPLTSLRDWREACQRSQARANEQRANEPFVPSWIEAALGALAVAAGLELLLHLGL